MRLFTFTIVLHLQIHGEWQRAVGRWGDQPGQFIAPRGLVLTPNEDFLLVVDGRNRRVVVLRATDGTWVRQLKGPDGMLQKPIGVAVVPSTGEVLVLDIVENCIFVFRSIDDDTFLGILGTDFSSGGLIEFDLYGLVVLDGPSRSQVC
jgi:DNA-binding beta-propeller fold protein YncE